MRSIAAGQPGTLMSKSLARVRTALAAAGIPSTPVEMAAETRTAEQAAAAAGCALDQIVKSILFQGHSGQLYLFLTAGGNRVDPTRAATLTGEPLGPADANTVRKITGFAIGGVSPLGHLTPQPTWMDPTLMRFETVWAAAGTPRHIFAAAPSALCTACKATVTPFTL